MAVCPPLLGLRREYFSHEAVFYPGAAGLVDAVAPFVRDGVALGEPVVVTMPPDRMDVLREELGADARRVTFLGMAEIGRNPSRIIPAWRRCVETSSSHPPVRGVGEVIWPGRRDVEIEECHLHEALLNVAFDHGPAWRLLCPYDTEALTEPVLREAMRTHPIVWNASDIRTVEYEGHDYARSAFAEPLPPAPRSSDVIDFDVDDLTWLRTVVHKLGVRAGLSSEAANCMTLAAHEMAASSVLRGGGRGSMVVWRESDVFVVEVRDAGTVADPLVGFGLSSETDEHGRVLWMANHLCDLVQVRSTDQGTVVRLLAWR